MSSFIIGLLVGAFVGVILGWILASTIHSSSNHVEEIDFITYMNERLEALRKTRIDGDVLQGSIRIPILELDDANFPMDVINSYVSELRDDLHKIIRERLNARGAERNP